jgi:hypothetical protein
MRKSCVRRPQCRCWFFQLEHLLQYQCDYPSDVRPGRDSACEGPTREPRVNVLTDYFATVRVE